MAMNYDDFIGSKKDHSTSDGFEPLWMPDAAFDFQRTLIDWTVRKGRAALFADCGLGKTLMELAFAENVVRKTNGNVLLLTPLAVTGQIHAEAQKFGVETSVYRIGQPVPSGIVIANYERLHHLDSSHFDGIVCDESSILKNFDGATKAAITQFARNKRYRLLATATAAPNDYIELGTSSEALGNLGHMDMLNRFFTNKMRNSSTKGMGASQVEWNLKGHAEKHFWRWVCSWARAVRKPSDVGGDDARYQLPTLQEVDHVVAARSLAPGMLFPTVARGLAEQREERRRTLRERCEKVADLVNDTGQAAITWCDLNDEGDLLEKLIPDAVQVSGKDSDDAKEEKILAFVNGQARVLVTKPSIGAWGLNFQHCAHMTFFPSHSFEQRYQAVRRCWRFGQQRPVHVDTVTTEGSASVVANLRSKHEAADKMFENLVAEMNAAMHIDRSNIQKMKATVPSWMK